MRRLWSLPLAGFLGAISFAAAPDNTPNVAPILNPEKEGNELASRLRANRPSENSEFRGTLIIRRRGIGTNMMPIDSVITANSTNWQVTYRVGGTRSTQPETLTIGHSANQTTTYRLATGTNDRESAVVISGARIDAPLAGSDFLLSDLGLEFLHWPQQRLLKHQMTRGRSCRVLESTNPQSTTNGYARVIAWVDVETDGILRAEAYDKVGVLIKEFLVGPVKKVNGQWQLQDMKMISPKARRETEIRFDLE